MPNFSGIRLLMTILRDSRVNGTFSSRLTRWVGRLLPFHFKVVYAPGRTMGMADCLSRHPSESNCNEGNIKAEEVWRNWYTVNKITRNECLIRNDFVSANHKEQNIPGQPIKSKLANSSELASASDRRKLKLRQAEKQRTK